MDQFIGICDSCEGKAEDRRTRGQVENLAGLVPALRVEARLPTGT